MANAKGGGKIGKNATASGSNTAASKSGKSTGSIPESTPPAMKSVGSAGGKSLATAGSASVSQATGSVGKGGGPKECGGPKLVACVVPLKQQEQKKNGDQKKAIQAKKKDGVGKMMTKTPVSPKSVIGAGASTPSPGTGSSISAVTESSILGKVRVPTLIVNPADVPTMRGSSDKSWMNVTVGGRRRPTAAEQQEQALKRQKRTLRAICVSAIVTVVFLVVNVSIFVTLLLALSEPASSAKTATANPGKQATSTRSKII